MPFSHPRIRNLLSAPYRRRAAQDAGDTPIQDSVFPQGGCGPIEGWLEPFIWLSAPWVFTCYICWFSLVFAVVHAALFPSQGILLIHQTASSIEISKGWFSVPMKNSVYFTTVNWTGKRSQETFHFTSLCWVRGWRRWSWPFICLFCFVWDFLLNQCFHPLHNWFWHSLSGRWCSW